MSKLMSNVSTSGRLLHWWTSCSMFCTHMWKIRHFKNRHDGWSIFQAYTLLFKIYSFHGTWSAFAAKRSLWSSMNATQAKHSQWYQPLAQMQERNIQAQSKHEKNISTKTWHGYTSTREWSTFCQKLVKISIYFKRGYLTTHISQIFQEHSLTSAFLHTYDQYLTNSQRDSNKAYDRSSSS
jgi:hypothetical protein